MTIPTRPLSYELFPPRNDAAAIALGRTIDRLALTDPAFISVTFGAGGSSRDRSLTVLQYILAHTDIEPMAHLTCIGSSHAEANKLVREFLDAGIRSFLALRGDLPADLTNEYPVGDLGSAAELVQLIHRVQVEREPFTQVRVLGSGATRLTSGGVLDRIAVAAFPSGHPRSHTIAQDIDALLAKEAAGANLAITQLFWRAEDYLNFSDRAHQSGVQMPILPGIMPVTNSVRLAKLVKLTGVEAPEELSFALNQGSAEEQAEYGIDFAAKLAAEVLLGGAHGLHLYTFNRHEAVIEVVQRLGYVTQLSVNERTRR